MCFLMCSRCFCKKHSIFDFDKKPSLGIRLLWQKLCNLAQHKNNNRPIYHRRFLLFSFWTWDLWWKYNHNIQSKTDLSEAWDSDSSPTTLMSINLCSDIQSHTLFFIIHNASVWQTTEFHIFHSSLSDLSCWFMSVYGPACFSSLYALSS